MIIASEFRAKILRLAHEYEQWLIDNPQRSSSQESFCYGFGYVGDDVMDRVHVYLAVESVRRCALAEAE